MTSKDSEDGLEGGALPLHGAASGGQAGGLAIASVPAVLRRAAELVEPDGAWLQRDAVLDARGRLCAYADAACFCLFGAVRVAAGTGGQPIADELFEGAWRVLENVLPGRDPIGWNDRPGRQQTEVVAALRKAAALADGAGHGTASTTDANSAPGISEQ